jgi:hypothetical protein
MLLPLGGVKGADSRLCGVGDPAAGIVDVNKR